MASPGRGRAAPAPPPIAYGKRTAGPAGRNRVPDHRRTGTIGRRRRDERVLDQPAGDLFAGLNPADEQKELTAQMIRMAELMTAGKPAADPEVQAEVDQHYRWVARHWTPTAQAYRNLGQMYVADERFRANYEAITTGLAAYQRDAMAVYADERLS